MARRYREERVKAGSGKQFSPLRTPTHEPTPEEIAEACERIRSTWNAAELLRRAGTMVTPPVTYEPILDATIGLDDA